MRTLALAATAAMLALATTAVAGSRPQTISLPDGWQPEGVAAHGSRLFVGSLRDGAVWTSDTKGRRARMLVRGEDGRKVAGIKVAGNKIFAAGADTGKIHIFDRKSGRVLRTYAVPDAGFINDVVVKGHNAYFTESAEGKPVFYVVRRSGRGNVRTVPITGDLVYQADFNANGIEAFGRRLITVQSNTGKLFTIDPSTGASKEIALSGLAPDVKDGDGLLRHDRLLYVVQNDNKIAVVRLSRDLSRGKVVRFLRDADFDVPTTVARANGDLFAVNARFGTTPTPTTKYDVVRVRDKKAEGADDKGGRGRGTDDTQPDDKGGRGRGTDDTQPDDHGGRGTDDR